MAGHGSPASPKLLRLPARSAQTGYGSTPRRVTAGPGAAAQRGYGANVQSQDGCRPAHTASGTQVRLSRMITAGRCPCGPKWLRRKPKRQTAGGPGVRLMPSTAQAHSRDGRTLPDTIEDRPMRATADAQSFYGRAAAWRGPIWLRKPKAHTAAPARDTLRYSGGWLSHLTACCPQLQRPVLRPAQVVTAPAQDWRGRAGGRPTTDPAQAQSPYGRSHVQGGSVHLTSEDRAWLDKAGRMFREQAANTARPRGTVPRRLPQYCSCCGCVKRYCNCRCCCQRRLSRG